MEAGLRTLPDRNLDRVELDGLGVEGVVPEEVEELVLEFWVPVGCGS